MKRVRAKSARLARAAVADTAAAVVGVAEVAAEVAAPDASATKSCFEVFKRRNSRSSASFYQRFGMAAEQHIEVEGTIASVLPGTMFRVVLDNKHEVLAHISGKMRKRFIRLTAGDRVRMEMSPYDLSKARITYRLR